jgi:HEAT repeat protein
MTFSFQAKWIEALNSPDLNQRTLAVQALSVSENPDLIPIFVEYLKHESNADLHALAKTFLIQLSDLQKAKNQRDPYGIFRI